MPQNRGSRPCASRAVRLAGKVWGLLVVAPVILAPPPPAFSQPTCSPGQVIGILVEDDGDVQVNNCHGEAIRLFVRVAMAEIGPISPPPAGGGSNFRERLLDPVNPGVSTVVMPFPTTGIPSPRVVTAWVRARVPWSSATTPGLVLATVTGTLWTSTAVPELPADEVAALQARLATEVRAAAIGLPVPSNSDCPDPFELGKVEFRNRSPFASYRLVAMGKYNCFANPASRPTDAVANEASYSRFEVTPESCCDIDTRVAKYNANCDCDNDGDDGQCTCSGSCTPIHTVTCGGYVVTEARARDGSFKRLPQALWSEPAMDANIHRTVNLMPSELNLGCEDFGTSGDLRWVAPGIPCGFTNDDDNDGVVDRCDPVVASSDSVSGGRELRLAAVVRNQAFNGLREGATGAAPSTFSPSSTVKVGGDGTDPPAFGDGNATLTVVLPHQDRTTSVGVAEGSVDLVVTQGALVHTRAGGVRSSRVAYVAASGEGASEGHQAGLDARTAQLLDIRGPAQTGDAASTPRLPAGAVFGLDVGRERSRIVVSHENLVSVFDTALGGRLDTGTLTFPSGRAGRGVAVEDEVDGGFARFAYALVTNPGQFRVVDLSEPSPAAFVSALGESDFPRDGYTPIVGEPLDIEIHPVGGDLFAYVTSVYTAAGAGGEGSAGMSPEGGGASAQGGEILPDPGDPGGGGGGGGCEGRQTLLTVLRTDRPNGFAAARLEQIVSLSCVDPATRPEPFRTEMGMAWNAARDTLYVAVPDLDGIKVLPRKANGTLDYVQAEFIATGARPTDVAIGTITTLVSTAERALVTSLGLATEPPRLEVINLDVGNVVERQFDLPLDSQPLSVGVHPDLTSGTADEKRPVVVADAGRNEITVLNVNTVLPILEVITLIPATVPPRRIAVQGQ